MYWKPQVPPPELPEDVKRRRQRGREKRAHHSKGIYILAAVGLVTLLVLLARYAIVPLLVYLGGVRP